MNLWQVIAQARANGKLVLGMGAGSIDSWLRQSLTALASRLPDEAYAYPGGILLV